MSLTWDLLENVWNKRIDDGLIQNEFAVLNVVNKRSESTQNVEFRFIKTKVMISTKKSKTNAII